VFDPELYTRWLQYGVFQPLFRPHAQEHIPAEPVYHDSLTKARAREAIELRYALLPYNYTLAFENAMTGMPLMRPLLFEEPENEKTWAMAGDYLWGNSFLVSPVTDSLATKKKVYFPEGSTWFDFFTGNAYPGGKKHKVALSPRHIPVFVRGGSFIPMVKPVRNTELYSTRELTVHFYFDPGCPESAYSLYDDDGKTPHAFEKGMHEFVHMKSTHNASILEITLESEMGSNIKGTDRTITLVIHNLKGQPATVTLDGNTSPHEWNGETKRLEIKLDLQSGSRRKVMIGLAAE
jgi:alpha-glucosidase/oligosaccharide 4-alpha-D-glucosyltransferase